MKQVEQIISAKEHQSSGKNIDYRKARRRPERTCRRDSAKARTKRPKANWNENDESG